MYNSRVEAWDVFTQKGVSAFVTQSLAKEVAPDGVHVAHVVVDAELFASGDTGALLERLGACLSEHFDVAHSTFQLEPADHAEREQHTHR